MPKTIGILGGMGPEAACDLFLKVIRVTPLLKGPIARDQDHLRVIIDSNPHIPDRITAILNNGEDPVPALQETARNLERAGAGLIAIPCNTAHYFWEEIQAAVRIPVLHMMEEVGREVALSFPGLRRAGLLGTCATVRTRLYDRVLNPLGVEVLVPESNAQAEVDRAILLIKAGELAPAHDPLLAAARELEREGAEALVLGCTEIPLVLRAEEVGVPLIDATWILAKAAVREALS